MKWENNSFRRFYLSVMKALLGPRLLEQCLWHGCRKPLLRKCLRLGTLAYAYAAQLEAPAIRLAILNRHYRIYVDLLEPPGVSSYFFGYADVLPGIEFLLDAGDIFIDAGANRGQYTLFGASVVGEHGKVLAFEPNPSLTASLKEAVRLNHWEHFVGIDQHALWNQSHQQMKLYCSTNPRNSGTSSVIFHGYDLAQDHYVQVETITLDEALHTYAIPCCHLLKIDVERAEYEVLQGITTFLEQRRVRCILIEMFCHSAAHQFLSHQGYTGFWAGIGQGLIPIDDIPDDRFGDYLFIQPDVSLEFAQRLPRIHQRLARS